MRTGRGGLVSRIGVPAGALETVLINPLRSRRIAEALGRLARNDRVDTVMLARFGHLDGLEATPPQPRNLILLSDLLALCRKLVEQLGALRKPCAGLAPEAAGCTTATSSTSAATATGCGPIRICGVPCNERTATQVRPLGGEHDGCRTA